VLRATLVFRYEDGVWKIAHRPLTGHIYTTADHHPPVLGPAARASIRLTRIVGARPRASQLAVSVLKRSALQNLRIGRQAPR
jgi:hypothetical protein